MNIPEDLKFAKTHEWARLEEDGTVTVGISDHAQAELTDIVFLELPESGGQVDAEEEVGVVESVKHASDIYSPVSGEILDINEQAVEDPTLINSDPYGDGWLFKVRVADTNALDGLMSPEAYKELIS